jgi:S1-C subfamily serine protease
MHDEDSGSAQQGGWQPPEYVSPWLPASGSPEGGEGANDTISYRGGPAYDAGQGPADGQGYPPPPGYGPGPAGPGYEAGPAGPGYGPAYGSAAPSGGPAGYGGPGYGGPAGYGGPGYGGGPGGPGYGGPGYGPPGYGQNPWGGYGSPPPPPPRSGFSRTLAYLAVAVLAAGAGAGVAVALNHNSSSSAALSPTSGNSGAGNSGTGSGGAGSGGGTGSSGGTEINPFGGSGIGGFGSGGTGGTNSGTGSLNASALSAKVDPGLVDVTSDLKYSGATAEGTGMVISSSGLVLTNNHVIDQSTSVSAQLVVSGKTYTAKVIGYNSTDDVALLQLEGASGLKTVSLSNSSEAKVGEAVLALGNAAGKGGLPSTAQGTIQALNQSIKASDEGANTTESLHGMLETDAPIQEGDSGGPLVNASGQVVGMDTAASASGNEGGADTTATQGFAIPINQAISIADEIDAGKASTTVHIGLSGFMGVNVADAAKPSDCGNDAGGTGVFSPAVSSGALVCDVYPGAPAAAAGLVGGDVITSVNGSAVTTADGLTNLMTGDHPGSQLSIVYVSKSGSKHTTTVTLTEWAK